MGLAVKKRVLFYSSVKTKRTFSIQGFYRTDIEILRDLGFKVILSKSCWDFLAFWKYDFAFIYFYRYGLLPAIFAKTFRKRVIFTGGIDYLCKEYAGIKSYRIQYVFFKLCNLFSDKSLIVSSADRDNIKKIYGGKFPRNNEICYHCIDTHPYKRAKNAPKERILLTIGWMGRIENVQRKGILRSVFVFNELKKLLPDYKLHIVGPKGDGSIEVERQIKKLGLEGQVILTGAVDEPTKIKYLLRSQFYLQLSEYEGFGLAAAEALLAGGTVIHSGRGGLRDAVGDFGIRVEDIDNYESIARLIYNLSATPVDKERTLLGVQYIEANFSYSRRKEMIQHALMNRK